jgi:hypothetical protein
MPLFEYCLLDYIGLQGYTSWFDVFALNVLSIRRFFAGKKRVLVMRWKFSALGSANLVMMVSVSMSMAVSVSMAVSMSPPAYLSIALGASVSMC